MRISLVSSYIKRLIILDKKKNKISQSYRQSSCVKLLYLMISLQPRPRASSNHIINMAANKILLLQYYLKRKQMKKYIPRKQIMFPYRPATSKLKMELYILTMVINGFIFSGCFAIMVLGFSLLLLLSAQALPSGSTC